MKTRVLGIILAGAILTAGCASNHPDTPRSQALRNCMSKGWAAARKGVMIDNQKLSQYCHWYANNAIPDVVEQAARRDAEVLSQQ